MGTPMTWGPLHGTVPLTVPLDKVTEVYRAVLASGKVVALSELLLSNIHHFRRRLLDTERDQGVPVQ